MLGRVLFRNMGVLGRAQGLLTRSFANRFQEAQENRQEQKQRQEFMQDIKFFLSKEVFTVHDFHQRVIYGLKKKSGFRNMITGGDAEYAELEIQHKICCTLFDEEKSSPVFIETKALKQEIATVAQVSEDKVEDTVEKFKEMQGLHEWLVKKRDNGEQLPQSHHEMTLMLQQDKPKFLQQKEDLSRDDITNQQRLYHLRRHHT